MPPWLLHDHQGRHSTEWRVSAHTDDVLMGRWRTPNVGAEFRNPGLRSVGLRIRAIANPLARTQEGTGRSSIGSRSEHRNQYYGPWYGSPSLPRPVEEAKAKDRIG